MKLLSHGLKPLRQGLAAFALVISGCTVGPNYVAPQTEVPAGWGELPSQSSEPSEFAITPTAEPLELAEWWTSFDDATLTSLIERAWQSNLDLRLAQSRVREARAQRGVVSAELFPHVDAVGSYSRSRVSENSFGGITGEPGSEGDLYQAGFDASWEIDVFGGVRRNIEAADADIAATIEDRRAVLVTLLAEVAQNYAQLRGVQRQVVIAQSNRASQLDTLALTQSRFEAGLSSDLDVARAEAQVRTIESQVPALQSAARQTIHTLSVLLGQSPMALAEELSAEAPIPTPEAEIAIGLPLDLLRRRPDIRRAEREIAAATARIGVATADLFPRFSITGSLGLQSTQFSDLGDYSSRFWSVGPSVSWPVLDWGRIRSNIHVQNEREEQAFIVYEQTVLTGLREVEGALTAFLHEQSRRDTLEQAVRGNRRAVDLSTELYQQGLSDFLSVLQAQRDLYITEDALVQSELAVTANLISLYKALGGGWELEQRAENGSAQQSSG